MSKDKKNKKGEEEVDPEVVPSTPDEVKASRGQEVDAYDIVNQDRYVRTYSLATHGENFKALAEQFCTKKPKMGAYSMVPSSQIPAVEVRYRERDDADLSIDEKKANPKMVNKTRKFTDKEEALRFGAVKRGSVVVPKKK